MNAIGAIAGVGLGLVCTAIVEGKLPVTAHMRAVEPTYSDGRYLARVEGYKIKDCIVVANSFVGWQKVGGTWRETGFVFKNDDTPLDSKPSGVAKQDFGIWEWYAVDADAEAVRLSLQHSCDGKLTVTTVNLSVNL